MKTESVNLRARALLLSLLLLPLFVLHASAQKDRGLGLKPSETVRQLPSKAKRYAIVIGFDRYDDTQITTLADTAQTEVTGALEGKVVNSSSNEPIKDAVVRIKATETGVIRTRRTDEKGKFFQGQLPPGIYTISISAPGFKTIESQQRLLATEVTKVLPYPTALEPQSAPQR
jgi:hypothetical protein